MLPAAAEILLVANDLAPTHPHHARKLREIAGRVARVERTLDLIVEDAMEDDLARIAMSDGGEQVAA